MNENVVDLNGNDRCQILFDFALENFYNNYEPEDHQAEQENSHRS